MINLENKKLIIFDMDDTLTNGWSTELLPHVQVWFDKRPAALKVAIATNQGGVSLREWMQQEQWGEPQKYPTAAEIRSRVAAVMKALDIPLACVAFAYQDSTGKWAPIKTKAPPHEANSILTSYQPSWRKPAPGMMHILQERLDVGDNTAVLFVGDSQEDKQAAANAGVAHLHPADFFGWPESLPTNSA